MRPPFFLENANFIYDNSIGATLNDTVESSDNVTVHYNRSYGFEWTKDKYSVYISPKKINSYEGLGSDADNYTWVHYVYYGRSETGSAYRMPIRYNPETSIYSDYSTFRYYQRIPVKSWYWRDALSPDVKVLDANKNQMSRDANGYYVVSDAGYASGNTDAVCMTSYWTCKEIFVGYPKNKYNESLGNNELENTVYSRGVYFRETNESELAEGKAKFVLSEFKLEYKGNDVGVFKKVDSSTPVINGAAIKGDNGGSVIFDITSQAMNTGGGKYDLVIGDDILYYEDVTDGVKKKLSEDDYYFEKIAKPGQIVGANGALFSCRVNLDGTYTNIYSAEVYYRLRGENEYKRLDLDDYYSSACAANTWSFTNSDELKGNVVGWRVVIKDMDRDIKDYTLKTTVTLKSQNLPENGKVYNFSYVEMDRNGVIVNVPELESYAEGVTRDKIAPYDLATYGHYQQRWVAEKEWEGYVLGNIIRRPYPNIYNSSKPVFDNSSDGFVGVMKGTLFTTEYSTDGEKNPKLFTAQMKDEDYISRVYGEFMLPEGVMLLSTKEEILDSIEVYLSDTWTQKSFDKNGERLFSSGAEAKEFIKNHATVKIVKNWHNTGRDLAQIEVDFSEKPYTRLNQYSSGNASGDVSFYVKYKIPYEKYVENPDASYIFRTYQVLRNPSCYIEGGNCGFYQDTEDYNDNGDKTEVYNFGALGITPLMAQAAEQSLKEMVDTDQTVDFTTNDSYVTAGGNYEYKLTARTGMSRATNIVTYSNIEMAYEDNDHWQGTFDGVDLTYANGRKDYNGKDIKVKVYYSTKNNAGSLGNDNSWREYIEGTTNKSQVKSLAFEYLTTDGGKATLNTNDYIYTIIKMKAPTTGGRGTFAYSAFRSEWNGFDADTGAPLPDIVGVRSNTTKVAIDHPLKIRVIKQWVDLDNKFSTRPATVTPQLKKGTSLVDGTKVISATSGNTQTIEYVDLHEYYKDDYDVVISRIATADGRSSYSTQLVSKVEEQDLITYTFKSELETDKIKVRKVWIDNDNKYNTRPNTLAFDLMKQTTSAEKYNMTIDKTVNSQEYEYAEFPKYMFGDFNVTMTPNPITHYSTVLTKSDSGHTYTFTSTLSDRIDIKVKHIWIDANNVRKFRPSSQQYTLKKTGSSSQSKTINFGADGTVTEFSETYSNLPLLDSDKYYMDDKNINHYQTVLTYDERTRTFIYTSTLIDDLDIKVEHIWIDDNNSRKFRPSSQRYTLYDANGSNRYKTINFGTDGTVTEFNEEFKNLNRLREADYSMQDLNINHYETTLRYEPSSKTYIYTSTLVDDLDINVKHIWIDDNDSRGLRPDSQTYTLKNSGGGDLKKTIDFGDDGSVTEFNDAFLSLDRRKEANFSMDNLDIEHYETTLDYEPSSKTYIYTSTLVDDLDIHVKQVWEDYDNHYGLRPDVTSYTLMKKDDEVDTKSLNIRDGESATDYINLHRPDKEDYDVPMIDVPHYTTTVEVTDEDDGSITYTFTSKLDVETVKVVHVWDDDDDVLGVRPEKTDYKLIWTDREECAEAEEETEEECEGEACEATDGADGSDGSDSSDGDATGADGGDSSDAGNTDGSDAEDDEEPEGDAIVCEDGGLVEATHELSSDEDPEEFEFIEVPSAIIDEFNVKMDAIDPYTTTVEYDEETHTFTFTSVLRNITIHVVNIWKDNNDELGRRPGSLDFELLLDGEKERGNRITTENETEKFDFAPLFEYLKDNYRVVLAKDVDGYTTVVEFDPETMTFTFIHEIIPDPEVPNTADGIVGKIAGLTGAGVLGFGMMMFLARRRRR